MSAGRRRVLEGHTREHGGSIGATSNASHCGGEVLGVRFALGEARLRVRVRVEARITQHGRR